MAVLRTAIDRHQLSAPAVTSRELDTITYSVDVLRTSTEYVIVSMTTAADLLAQMARDSEEPVISEFGLYALARVLFRDQGYKGTPIPPRNRTLTERRARQIVAQAVGPDKRNGAHRLPRDPDFASIHFMIRPARAAEVMLAADPFCCLSHASALAAYGLIKSSKELHLVTPDRVIWQEKAAGIMEAVIGFPPDEAMSDELPFRMTRPKPNAKVRNEPVHRHELKDPVVPTIVNDVRVTPIGETFRDALSNPAWCGGIEKVITCWRKHAKTHREAILSAIEASDEKILRVRAGYLLDEVIGLSDPRIDGWLADAQRGSSRKLDSAAPYASTFSAKWMLSINVPDPTLPSVSA